MLTTASTGVIVARFQVHELHPGHRYLVEYVAKRHDRVCIVLGVRRSLRTATDPLLYEERVAMIREAYPDPSIMIIPLYDHPISTDRWSRSLDQLLNQSFPGEDTVLYGSRESFLKVYSGALKTYEVPPMEGISGTALREGLAFPNTPDARAAIIYAERTRPGITYSTVDLAIFDKLRRKVLLIGKLCHEELLSFMGGFLDPLLDDCDKDAALRERSEELLGISIGDPVAIDDRKVDDPRYRGTPDAVKTRLFCAEYLGGTPKAGDDAASAHWVDYESLVDPSVLVPWHLPLGERVLAYLNTLPA